MRSTKIIHTVSCHAEGEVGDVIVGGVSPPPGDSIWEQRKWLAIELISQCRREAAGERSRMWLRLQHRQP